MNPLEQFEAELGADDPYAELHGHLARNDDRMLEDLVSMRKSKRLSQDVVAQRMNRSKTAVSNFERLGADPHLSTIRRYAAAIGAQIATRVCNVDDFDHCANEVEVSIAYHSVRRSELVEEFGAIRSEYWIEA